MTAAFVIDCSVTMAWCFSDETTPGTKAVQDRMVTEMAVVPSHWALEVTNVLALAERRQRISAEDATEFLALLRQLSIEVDDQTSFHAFDDILKLSRLHGLTAYDAAYLELALRRQLPLASLDEPLCRAAAQMGVELIIA